MDRKAIAILIVSFGLFLMWGPLVNKLFPPVPVPVTQVVTPTGTNVPPTAEIRASTNAAVAGGSIAVTAPAAVALRPTGVEKLEVLETNNVRYIFTSFGGGLKAVELLQYPESVDRRSKKSGANTNVATLNLKAPVAAMTLLGSDAIQGDGEFTLTRTAGGLRAEKVLPNGLYLVKEFQPTSNYLVSATVHLENRSAQAVHIPASELVIGTAMPMDAHDNETSLGAFWYDGSKGTDIGATSFGKGFFGCASGAPPKTEFLGGASNVVWAATHNQFFTIAVVPKQAAPQLLVRRLDLPLPTVEEKRIDPKVFAEPHGFQTALLYPETVLAPGKAWEQQYEIYAGPKEYHTLAKLGEQFKNNLDLIMGFGFWSFFSKMLLLSMNGLHRLGLPYGLAIITITVTIKVIFWPLTAASTRSAKRMATLQPQLKALQDKYKDDPQKQQAKMWEFYRENKVNPMGGCLPMVVQVPVFFGLFRMLQSAIELRGAEFLWIADLSKPDTLFNLPGLHIFGAGTLFGALPLLGGDFPVNPMPMLMGVTMLWQASLTPPAPGMDPMQQKMMKYMPLMFLLILYNYSAGLTLYWTVQNLLTITQTKLTKALPEEDKKGAGTLKKVKN